MSWDIALVLIGTALFFLLVGGTLYLQKKKHQMIRTTGKQVMAIITDVHCWQGPSLQITPLLQIAGSRYNEVSARWTDPSTGESYTITSEQKRGLPSYRLGDHVSAFISEHGLYLDL